MSRPQIALTPAEPIEDAQHARPGAQRHRFIPDAPVPLPLPVASNDAAPPAPARHALHKRLLLPATLLLAIAVGSVALLGGRAPRHAASPAPRDKPPYSLTAAWRGIGQRTATEAVHPGVPRIEDNERAAMESAPEAPAPAAAGKPSAPLSTVEQLTQLALDAVAALPDPASAGDAATADVPSNAAASTVAAAPPTQPSDATPAAADRAAPPVAAAATDPSAAAPVAAGEPTDLPSPTVDRGPPVDEPKPDRRGPETTASATSTVPPLPRRKPAAIHRYTPDPVQPRHRATQPLRKTPPAAPAIDDVRLEHVFKGFDHKMP